MEDKMKYQVHHLEVKRDTAQERLQNFLNQLKGEVLAVVPYISPTFQLMGATSKVDYLLIVEKVA
jgi:rhamnose utilization protein RhaD (predicted bifunctional aldolase and dehydrogenase)